ncbi:16S rRNA (cytidine(1402)-2'-O)-methyltransferase [Candidatus Falkowbacteria bacterium]|nr:16S rRNA (cytidine(1402)-2'-O)-methyltransferase [Candidatus Falkowbacteria bacterium]
MSNLYIVATPIGNLADITLRALETLKSVDVIFAEDSRVAKKLLAAYSIATPVMTYHHHSVTTAPLQKLKEGKNVAVVSDAGTPGISDPGGALIEAVTKNLPEVKIIPITGTSALAAVISVAGIPMQEFTFKGFVPHKKGRQTFIKEVCESKIPVIFFESVHRIVKALQEIAKVQPHKQIVLCRELTKMFETIYRGTAQEILEQLKPDQIKGEFAVLAHDHN